MTQNPGHTAIPSGRSCKQKTDAWCAGAMSTESSTAQTGVKGSRQRWTGSGLRVTRTEMVEPSGDTRPTRAGEGDEQLHTQQAGISSGQFKQTACNASATGMNENSSPAENHNLLMMGSGKTKLATVHYVFDPTELESIANETRPFTRDGFAKGSIYRHLGCSKGCLLLGRKAI